MASKPNKLAFLSMPAPASYVAGLGRGASGFTTRSDIGPAREGPSAEAVAEAQARRGEETEYEPEQFQDPDNEMGLFAGMTYEADDEEADKIYEFVDKNMDARRRARREAREAVELAKARTERPKIEQQFADLKRGLAEVTDEEWSNLPEVGNLTRKKRKKDDRSFVVPDSILVGDRAKNEYENALDPMQQETGGFETPAENGTLTNFLEIGQARDKILSLKLDQISGTATSMSGTSTSIDPKGYLTDLNSIKLKTDAEIGDIKRARSLLDSLIKSNPGHAPGWIAAARTEEAAQRMVAARKLILAGCEKCPKSEDVWLAASSLHNTQDAKKILAKAVQELPQSVKIWTEAANLEQDPKSKKRVLRRALEHVPNSVLLWKKAVNLETSITDARVLLARAVEVIPQSIDLWLALARMETPEKARTVLNSARKAVPTSHEIWVAAGRLLEQEAMKDGKTEKERNDELRRVDATIESGVRQLRQHQVILTREEWQRIAEKCEEEGSPRTCEAIIKATVGMDLDESEQLKTWIDDANEAASSERGKIVTARAILAHALKLYPDKSSLWEQAANLEKTHGTRESLDAILSRAVEHCPQAEILWLKYAKEKWLAGDVAAARDVLGRAFDVSPESEEIWLAAVKLEAENGEISAARELLTRARNLAGKERIWMKSAVFERQQGQLPTALSMLEVAIKKYPKFAKFYMIQGQIHQSVKDFTAARGSFTAGIKACPKNVTLWILSSRLEEVDGKSIKSRSLLDRARLANPGQELLWAEAVGVEERSGNSAQAKAVLSRGLQECPHSGLLWTMAIFMEPRPTRKARATDAANKTMKSEDPRDSAQVTCAIARLFWSERKVEKARRLFERSVSPDSEPDWGDSWAWWLKFEREHGSAEQQQRVIDLCSSREPRHGILWPSIAKDISNFGRSTAEILERVLDALE